MGCCYSSNNATNVLKLASIIESEKNNDQTNIDHKTLIVQQIINNYNTTTISNSKNDMMIYVVIKMTVNKIDRLITKKEERHDQLMPEVKQNEHEIETQEMKQTNCQCGKESAST